MLFLFSHKYSLEHNRFRAHTVCVIRLETKNPTQVENIQYLTI
jgi:hypothetical protein